MFSKTTKASDLRSFALDSPCLRGLPMKVHFPCGTHPEEYGSKNEKNSPVDFSKMGRASDVGFFAIDSPCLGGWDLWVGSSVRDPFRRYGSKQQKIENWKIPQSISRR